MYAKEKLDHFEENLQKSNTDFVVKKVSYGSGTGIPDTAPVLPKSSGSGSETIPSSNSVFFLLLDPYS